MSQHRKAHAHPFAKKERRSWDRPLMHCSSISLRDCWFTQGECKALLIRLLSAHMIFSAQMENSLPTVAISNYCMRGCYMIYEISMHAWLLKSQLRRKDAAITAWEIRHSTYLLLNLLAYLIHTPSRVLHSWLAMQAWIATWFMKSQCIHDFWRLSCGEKMQQSLRKK